VLEKNLKALAQSVSARGQRIVVYNPLPWQRDGLVSLKLEGDAIRALKPAEGGAVLPAETSGELLRFVARDVPPMGYRTYVPVGPEANHSGLTSEGNQIESPFFKATLDPARGVVRSLIAKPAGRELVDAASPVGLGQYLYERFTSNQVRLYCETYLRGGDYTPANFGKPGLPSAEQVPYQALSPKDFKLSFEQTPVSVTATMESAPSSLNSFNSSNSVNHPVTTRLILYRELPFADLEITLHEKPFEPWPEAGWLCLPLRVDQAQFHLGRLASIIDPARDVIAGANRHIFGLNSGFTITDPQGQGAGFCPIDHPLVSLDVPGCWKYSLDFVPKKPVAYLNLFNNQWNTNFRFWNQGTWTSRVRLWAIDHYAAEPALITPSEEARFPLQAAVADGAAGKLSPSQRGVEISGKGSLVTAFGQNPDGEGTVLRLWEYAGNTGPHEIRLPAGIEVSSVQPITLRGQPLGKPIALHGLIFSCNLSAFAPASFLLVSPVHASARTGMSR
jgi:hypothetical protein